MDAGVLTLTLSPCVDRTVWLDADGKTEEVCEQSGGKGLNVARVLANLGSRAVAVFPAGVETGKTCVRLAEEEGIAACPVAVKGDTRVIVTFAEKDTFRQRQEYVSAPVLSSAELDGLRAAVTKRFPEHRIFCVCGAAPDETAALAAKEMMLLAKEAGLITVLDSHGAMLPLCRGAADVIKPNAEEAACLLGRDLSCDDLFSACEELGAQGQTVLLTMGEKGALCAADGNLYCAPAPKVNAVNPVGSGDSFLAGWLHARIQGMDNMDALKFACRLGAENAAMFPAARVGGNKRI